MSHLLEYLASDLPVGRSGDWTIEKIHLPRREGEQPLDPRPDCFKYRPGTYTCLRRGPTQFMTDLYDEWWTQRAGINEATKRGGEILITGLGLGLIAEAILKSGAGRVERVTIVENSADVIRLVGPYLRSRYGDRIDIIHGDAFRWRPSATRHFTVGWHDIWPDPYAEPIADEILQLEKHHRAWCDWQGFWPREYLGALALAS